MQNTETQDLKLQWDHFSGNMKELMSDLYKSSDFSDVTLVCDDNKTVKAHKFILGASSPILKEILDMHGTNPWIYMRKTQYSSLQKIIEFMYLGEAVIDKENIDDLFSLSMDLQIDEIINSFRSVVYSDMIEDKKDISDIKFALDKNPFQLQENLEGIDVNQSHSVATEESEHAKNTEFVENPKLQDIELHSSIEAIESTIMRKKRGPKSKTLNKENKTNPRGGPAQCPGCGKIFKQSSSMQLHYRSFHKGIKLSCDQCDYKTYQKVHLNTHINVKHKNIMLYCDMCFTAFTDKGNLKHHIDAIHTGIKYDCDHCEYKAKSRGALKTHNEIKHQGVRHQCQYCEHKAIHKSALYQHIRIVHEGFRYQCDQCHHQTTRPNYLREHIEAIHKKGQKMNSDEVAILEEKIKLQRIQRCSKEAATKTEIKHEAKNISANYKEQKQKYSDQRVNLRNK